MPKPISFGSTPSPAPVVAPMVESTAPVGQSVVPVVTRVYDVPVKRLTLDEVNKYGQASMAAMGQVNDAVLKQARSADMDEIGKSLGDLLVSAEKYSPDHLGKVGGIMPFMKLTLQRLRNNFDTVHGQVETLTKKVDGQIQIANRQIVDLAAMFENARRAYNSLGDEMTELADRIAAEEANPPIVDPSDPFSSTEYQKWQTTISQARQHLDNLGRQQLFAQQQAAFIAMTAANSNSLVQQFGSVKTFTIPNLKQSFALAIQMMQQEKMVKLREDVSALDSATIRKNATMLGTNTVRVQEASAKSIVSIEDLKFSNDAIIKAVADVKRIQQEMKDRIVAERPQVEAMSQELMTLQATPN